MNEAHDVYDATSRMVNIGWDDGRCIGWSSGDSDRQRFNIPQTNALYGLWGFWVENMISPDVCDMLVEKFEAAGFDTHSDVAIEYPPGVRNNKRVIVKLPNFTENLWLHLQSHLTETEVVGWKPYGWASEGWWLPIGVNDVWVVSRYEPGQHFAPHRDGMYKDTTTGHMSIFTLTLYLGESGQDFTGGDLVFFSPSTADEEVFRWKPLKGSAFVMNHDCMHAGAPVTAGTKYIMRSSVMFQVFVLLGGFFSSPSL